MTKKRKLDEVPAVWGEGAIVALSGYQEETVWGRNLVGSTTKSLGVRFHLPFSFLVSFLENGKEVEPETCRFYLAGGDLIAGFRGDEQFVFSPLKCDSFIGQLPTSWEVSISARDKSWSARKQPTVAGAVGWQLAFALREDGRFALAIGQNEAEALAKLQAAWKEDWEGTWAKRRQFYEELPLPEGHEQVAKKAWSILKVNVESGGSWLPCRWTTPDRIPHKDMWLWDSAFHSLGWSELDGEMAQEALKAILLQADPKTGFIPHQARSNWRSEITQPPLLAWATWEVVRKHGDLEFASWALPILERYLLWDEANRDQNRNGLLEWFIAENPDCRSGESGMDNSPRFDAAQTLDAVDFSSFLAHEYFCLSKLAALLEDEERAEKYQNRGEGVAKAVNDYLYHSREGFYFDRDMNGKFSRVKACSGFAPLFAGICSPKQAEALVRHLEDPAQFATQVPVPSVAYSDPAYSTDMWRGPSWLNWTYLIVCGLERYGYHKLARRISLQVVAAVEKWYGKAGTIFEYYDSADQRSPAECHRKGPVAEDYYLQNKTSAIRDYNWSAACYLLFLEKLGQGN